MQNEIDPPSRFRASLRRLGELREATGLSWRVLAAESEVPLGTVQQWLRSTSIPDEVDGIIRIDGALRRKVQELRLLDAFSDVLDYAWATEHAAVQNYLLSHRSAAAQAGRARRASALAETKATLEALKGLLRASVWATDALPYTELDDSLPRLSDVYVEPGLALDRTETASFRLNRHGEATPLPVDVAQAFRRDDLVLVRGAPGMGKSALLRHVTRRQAQWWLSNGAGSDPHDAPYGRSVPLVVPAVDCVGRSLPDAMLLGMTRMAAFLPEGLPDREAFARQPAPGVKWLVLVDGLDEILDPQQRTAVVRALQAHVSDSASPYRVLATARLGTKIDLRGVDWLEYRLLPFNSSQRAEFFRRWAECRGLPPGAAETVSRHIGLQHWQTKELLETPLLASVFCVLYEENSDTEIPGSRSELYDRFINHLLYERRGRIRFRDELYTLLDPYFVHSSNLVDWLFDSSEPLLRHIAFNCRPYADLLPEAIIWLRENCPYATDGFPSWNQLLSDLLLGTGLITGRGNQLKFTHQTFGDYLAAKRWGENFQLDEWLELAGSNLAAENNSSRRYAEPGTALFALHHLTQVGPEDARRVIEHLLSGQRVSPTGETAVGDPLLAARALTAGCAVARERAEEIIDALLASMELPGGRWWYAQGVLRSLVRHPKVAGYMLALTASGTEGAEWAASTIISNGAPDDRDAVLQHLTTITQQELPRGEEDCGVEEMMQAREILTAAAILAASEQDAFRAQGLQVLERSATSYPFGASCDSLAALVRYGSRVQRELAFSSFLRGARAELISRHHELEWLADVLQQMVWACPHPEEVPHAVAAARLIASSGRIKGWGRSKAAVLLGWLGNPDEVVPTLMSILRDPRVSAGHRVEVADDVRRHATDEETIDAYSALVTDQWLLRDYRLSAAAQLAEVSKEHAFELVKEVVLSAFLTADCGDCALRSIKILLDSGGRTRSRAWLISAVRSRERPLRQRLAMAEALSRIQPEHSMGTRPDIEAIAEVVEDCLRDQSADGTTRARADALRQHMNIRQQP
jgi:hypothetical protein